MAAAELKRLDRKLEEAKTELAKLGIGRPATAEKTIARRERERQELEAEIESIPQERDRLRKLEKKLEI